MHLRSREDPSVDLYQASKLLTQICDIEPNVNKSLVSELYDEIVHRMEAQFEGLFLDLSAKETAIQALQENAELFNGYDEAQQIATRIARYSKQLTTIVDFGQKNHDKFLSTYGTGLTESLLAKQTKILFEHQIKQEIFHAQMLRLVKKNVRSD